MHKKRPETALFLCAFLLKIKKTGGSKMAEGKTIMKRGMQFVLLLFGLIIWMTTGTVKAEAADAGSSQSGDYGSFVDGEQVIKDMIEKNGMESHW